MENYITPIMSSNAIQMSEDFIIWYVVATIILVALAASILAACILYCEVRGYDFAGKWSYTNGGGSIKLGCE